MSSFNLQANTSDVSSFDPWANSLPETDHGDFDKTLTVFILGFIVYIVLAVIIAINELSKAIKAKPTKAYAAINKPAHPDAAEATRTPVFLVIPNAHFISMGQVTPPPPNAFQYSRATELQLNVNKSTGDSPTSGVSYLIPVRRIFETENSYHITVSNEDSISLPPLVGR